MAAAPPWRRAVCGKASGVHVAAGGGLRGGRQLAMVIPAALAAGRPAQPVAGLGPGAAPVVTPAFALCRGCAVLHLAVRPDGQARADRHGAGGHDHGGPVGPDAPPVRATQPARPVAGRFRRRCRHGDQGRGFPAAADGPALVRLVAVPASPRPCGGRPASGQPALADPGLPAGPDRHPLRQRLASPPAGLVLPAGDPHPVAAGQPAAAAAVQAMVAPPAPWRPPAVAAAGLGAAGAGVLQCQPGQARGLSAADAAGHGAGRRTAAAGPAAPAVRAPLPVRLQRGADAGHWRARRDADDRTPVGGGAAGAPGHA
ncbi:hypothetical protein G6F57_016112 [Rhizopus arrhizus]|nr:hypothetical protein G6F57_016112 [Rhizopus arrhizus]